MMEPEGCRMSRKCSGRIPASLATRRAPQPVSSRTMQLVRRAGIDPGHNPTAWDRSCRRRSMVSCLACGRTMTQPSTNSAPQVDDPCRPFGAVFRCCGGSGPDWCSAAAPLSGLVGPHPYTQGMLVSRVNPDTAQGHAPGDDPGAPLAIAACRAAPGRDCGG